MGSSASGPALAGQDALLPPMDVLGQGEQLCSAPSPAVIPLPAGRCWSQLGSAGPSTVCWGSVPALRPRGWVWGQGPGS